MDKQKLRVLLIIEQCLPDSSSVFLVGFKFFQEINKLADVTLVTHERSRCSFEKQSEYKNIIYVKDSLFSRKYFDWTINLAFQGKIPWSLWHMLAYPVYAEFNHNVYQTFKSQIEQGEYDIVHAITPMPPRYPYKVTKLYKHVPVFIGPLNGGVPFPPGFEEIGRSEGSAFNFLRAIGRLIVPGYKETYRKATHIFSGSKYTLQLLKDLFHIQADRISLLHENGVEEDFFNQTISHEREAGKINILFTGRLTPYKCPDIVIEAIAQLEQAIRNQITLTIVGGGSDTGIEQKKLENLSKDLNLDGIINITGWLAYEEAIEYYKAADIFCFPSIREFGGSVVLEAMAFGLPCIVVNNGGIAEYVTDKTGFKIEPVSRDYLIQEVKDKITILVENPELRKEMSMNAVERAKEFTWQSKAQRIIEIYEKVLHSRVEL